MKLFHGSALKNLKIIKQEFSSADNFEGQANYFTDSYEVATEYAGPEGSVYTVQITLPCLDLSTKENIKSFLIPVFSKNNIDIELLEYLDAGISHVLNHNGKNGIWSLPLDVAEILKFEPYYKNLKNLKDVEKQLTQDIEKSLQNFSFFKIIDSGNYPYHIFICFQNVDVVKEDSL